MLNTCSRVVKGEAWARRSKSGTRTSLGNQSRGFFRVRCAYMVQDFAATDGIPKLLCIPNSLDKAVGIEAERPPSPRQRMK